ncbi:hypothetical protein ACPV5T_02645 [Vibrio astriarenae]
MRALLNTIMITLFVFTQGAWADDAEHNATARKIKTKLEKALRKQTFEDNTYCDVMIEMEHSHKYARIKRVSARGDHQLCKQSKHWLVQGKKFRYTETEKFIRLHLVSNGI